MKTMMKEMMREMMQEMMMETMKELMGEMMTPEVANAEVVEEPKVGGITRARNTENVMSREEWLALKETSTPTKKEVDYTGLDIVSVGAKMVGYNMKVSSDIWQYTDMVVRNKYKGRCTKWRGKFYWIFEQDYEKKNFLQCFKVVTEFTPEQLADIREYKKNKDIERAKRTIKALEG